MEEGEAMDTTGRMEYDRFHHLKSVRTKEREKKGVGNASDSGSIRRHVYGHVDIVPKSPRGNCYLLIPFHTRAYASVLVFTAHSPPQAPKAPTYRPPHDSTRSQTSPHSSSLLFLPIPRSVLPLSDPPRGAGAESVEPEPDMGLGGTRRGGKLGLLSA
ncbi:hypothetical protein C4D60_Mb02t12420 [Musa balbisiana]|uniref:Uncharacterized protein n=1 Tax=Musa balbisiana TaxID=52838 RepID=A0A4V4H2M5_MUSBA|nr:hypothetical protein C4D60_Mb02t12420 [Musa balbisiana]